jgi:SAM-dependent methyltransferase
MKEKSLGASFRHPPEPGLSSDDGKRMANEVTRARIPMRQIAAYHGWVFNPVQPFVYTNAGTCAGAPVWGDGIDHRASIAKLMALVSMDEITCLLVCPRCDRRLVRKGARLRCQNADCDLGGADFSDWGGMPVLVDFERSILQREDLDRRAGVASPPSIARLPSLLRSLWKPRNEVAAANIGRLLSQLNDSAPLILVVGGGSIGNGADALYEDPRVRLVAFDIGPSSVTQFVADAHQIPLADRSVDAVVVQAVLEHVLQPETVVSEIHRVLRPDGLVYAETPFMQQVHAGAYDFVRYTSSGHRYLFRRFEELDAGSVAGGGTQLLWSFDHVTRGLLRSQLAGKIARGAFFWLRYLDRVIPSSYNMDNASAYYFLGRRSERELSMSEIATYYRGAQRS